MKAFYFHFSLLELQKPTLAGPWILGQLMMGEGQTKNAPLVVSSKLRLNLLVAAPLISEVVPLMLCN